MKSPEKKYVAKRSWRDLYILRSSKLRDHDSSEIGIKKKRVEHQESFPEICRMSHAMYTNINVQFSHTHAIYFYFHIGKIIPSSDHWKAAYSVSGHLVQVVEERLR